MGAILGLLVEFGLGGGAWSGDLQTWGIGAFVLAAMFGVFIAPVTAGSFMTGVMFFSPLAALARLTSGLGRSELTGLGIGMGALARQFLIRRLRGGVGTPLQITHSPAFTLEGEPWAD